MLLNQILAMARAGQIETEGFFLPFAWNTLLANATTQVIQTVQSDADFVIMQSSLCAYQAAGIIVPNPDILMTILDTGTGRQLQSGPFHVNTATGTGGLPFKWPEPKLCKAGGTIQVTLQNLTAVAMRVDLTFHGFKVFYVGA